MLERYHLTPVGYTTHSGLDVIKWILLLVVLVGNKGVNNVSIFKYEERKPVPIAELDVIFHEFLE